MASLFPIRGTITESVSESFGGNPGYDLFLVVVPEIILKNSKIL